MLNTVDSSTDPAEPLKLRVSIVFSLLIHLGFYFFVVGLVPWVDPSIFIDKTPVLGGVRGLLRL